MRNLPVAAFVALLMIGCGQSEESVQEEAKDDPGLPLLIPCAACGEKVSKKAEKCLKCGHPTSVNVFKALSLYPVSSFSGAAGLAGDGTFPVLITERSSLFLTSSGI